MVEFAERMYEDTLSAKMMAALIVDECNRLYAGEPGDDTTVAAVRVRAQAGEPDDRAPGRPGGCGQDDGSVLLPKRAGKSYAEAPRKAGGRLSARGCGYQPGLRHRPGHPPHCHNPGHRPWTEGVITLSRVVEYANVFLNNSDLTNLWSLQTDGASRIAQYLFEYATDICFLWGVPSTRPIRTRIFHHLRHQDTAGEAAEQAPSKRWESASASAISKRPHTPFFKPLLTRYAHAF